MSEESDELETAIDTFLSGHDEEFMSASRLTNPLLHIWKLANDLSPELAKPVEELLTALSGRKLVKSSELVDAMGAVRDLLPSVCGADVGPSAVH